MGQKKTSELWGLETDERLEYTEMDVAIEAELDGRSDLTGTLVICGYAREVINDLAVDSLSTNTVECLLEGLHDDYGNPDGDYQDPTDEMQEAARVFIQAILKDYTIWRCEIVERETIDVAEWVKANRPDWLEELKPSKD